jgi:O-antigen/teichoic acid export membrane protein
LLSSAVLSLLEGLGRIENISLLKILQGISSSFALWLVLYFEGGLYSILASGLVQSLFAITWILYFYKEFIEDILRFESNEKGMDWRREIFPFHWRIALSWISGYLVFQAYNPVLFKIEGPISAGKFGLTMQIFSALNGGAIAWISAKVPTYGQLIALKKREELDLLFFRGVVQSTIVLVIGIVAFLMVVKVMALHGITQIERILPFNYVCILALSSLANHFVFCEAAYLRAHKEEPFLIISIGNAALTVLMLYLLVPIYGVLGAVLTYSTAAIFISFAGGTHIFINKRKNYDSR